MEEFIQEFKRAARGSRYEGRPLVEEFKRGMNGGIRRKLMEVENPPASIEQWYKRATALDQNWRESQREEERLRGKKEAMGGAPKQEQRQNMPRPLVWQRRQQPPQQATTSSVGNNNACFDGRNRKNECSSGKGSRARCRSSS